MLHKNEKGFTLIECIVVIIIVGIVMIMWGAYSKDSIKLAMVNEGQTISNMIVEREKEYIANNFQVATTSSAVTKLDDIYVDVRSNDYYNSFKITGGPAYTAHNALYFRGWAYYTLTVELYPRSDKAKYLSTFKCYYDTKTNVIRYDAGYGEYK